ncbi:S-layer protein [Yoonia vestfoldensis]|uniref:S-layer protein n=1 Tax=Yoonia vestfoldensis TaxID=245188 RepID=A0A1Y0EE76_9RHOB|nr:S-layer protein [Yoonia vestfoldensis]
MATVNVVRGDGTQSIKVDGAGVVNLENFALSSTNAAADVSLDFGATATTATIGLNKIVAGATAAVDDVTLVGAKLTTVNINVTGTKSVVEAIDTVAASAVNIDAAVALETNNLATTSSAATLTVSGVGKVDVGALDVGFTTVNASGNSGGLVAQIGTNDQTVLTGSSGDDVITASTTDALASTDKLAVNAGAGNDTLIIAAAADVNTAADGARYTGFETVRVTENLDMSLIAGVTGIEVASAGGVYTNMTAAQLANITFLADNTTSTTFTLASATGLADTATIRLASATATSNVDVIGVSVIGVETVNIIASTGTNTSGDSDFGFLANAADSVKAVNISGSADVDLNIVANTFDVVAVAINASGLTGTGHLEITGGVLVSGSTVVGSANGDTIVVSTTTGTAYSTGAGDDKITTAAASLAQTGANDNSINGGDGTDTIHISDNGSTLTDNHFIGLSNVEKLSYDDGGAVSLTTGSAFSSAFGSGVTITAAGMDDAATFTYAGGLFSGNATLAVTTAGVGNATGENITITTGGGTDSVTLTAASWVGVAGDTSVIAITTNAGNDTISLSGYNLAANTTTIAIQIDAGTGADTITLSGDNGAGATAYANFVINGGDSTIAAYDRITGFEVGDATNYSSALDFDGTSAKATAVTADGVAGYSSAELTMTISAAGIVTFAGTSAAGLTATNVISILDAEITTSTHTAIWSDGTDSYVFNANSTGDSVVMLVGLTGVDALVTSAGLGANDLFIA